MTNTETCSRCKNEYTVRPVRGYRYGLRLGKKVMKKSLIFQRWYFEDQDVKMHYSELHLCNDCAVKVWMFAQGQEDK